MTSIPDPLPADLAEAHAMILAERAARRAAEAEAAAARRWEGDNVAHLVVSTAELRR